MLRRRVYPAAVFVWLSVFAVTSVRAQQVAESGPGPVQDLSALHQIAGDALVHGRAYSTLEALTDRFGARLTGSDNYNRAAQWAAEQFRSYGVDDVKLEPWTLAHTWRRISAAAAITTPKVQGEQPKPLHIASMGWSSSTPKAGVEGEVIQLFDISPDGLAKVGAQVRGKIVFVDQAQLKPRPKTQWGEQLSDNLKPLGALALLEPSRLDNDVIGTGDPAWEATILGVPTASLGHEDAETLKRWLKAGAALRVRVDIQNEVGGAAQVPNIVAEVRGSGASQEWVLLGAHFDSWDFATGAQDNGAGTAQVMEAARVIAAMARQGKRPARTIRFALFGGEEEGLLGSEAYAAQHASELPRCAMMLNTDNGAGHPKGWSTEGRSDVADALKPYSDALLKQLGGGEIVKDIDFDTDHGFFMLRGVPVLNMYVDMSKYGQVHHLVGDTIDKVNDHNLADGAALLAVTGWAIADATLRLAPQLDQSAVKELLKQDDLGEYLQAQGLWKGADSAKQ